MEISMQWLDGRTLLTVTQRGLPSGDIEQGYIDGWNEFLDGFVATIQTRSAT
jgi:Activator of Hsp90 ATPase homolog 1-like protein